MVKLYPFCKELVCARKTQHFKKQVGSTSDLWIQIH